jgi:hypothetical protein
MSDMPPGWARAEAEWLADPRDRPSICDTCDQADGCERDPVDCEGEARDQAAEERWEASRDARD